MGPENLHWQQSPRPCSGCCPGPHSETHEKRCACCWAGRGRSREAGPRLTEFTNDQTPRSWFKSTDGGLALEGIHEDVGSLLNGLQLVWGII